MVDVRKVLQRQLADKQVAFVNTEDEYYKKELKREIKEIRKKLAKMA